MTSPTIVLALLTLAALPAQAEECYAADAAGGAVSFRVLQAGSPFTGRFRRFAGELCLAEGRVTRIGVRLEPESVDTGLPELDAALKDKEFFAVGQYPRIAFVSRSVRSQGDSQLARGTLEVKGKRREVEVAFRLHQAGGKPTVSGSMTLDRLQYDIGSGEWSNTAWLGAEVKVDFEATLSRK